MSVIDRMKQDVVAALKAGDKRRVTALRTIVSELQKAAKDGNDDEIAVLQRERKRRVEAAAAYRDGGRDDLADGEDAEATLIDGYLPEPLSDDDLAALVGEALAETGAESPKDIGAVMAVLMPRVKGRADGGRVSALVKERLLS